jgi:hypothetical protein
MSGAIPLLPQYAFMAWCSVKAQGQFTFTFENNIVRRIFGPRGHKGSGGWGKVKCVISTNGLLE